MSLCVSKFIDRVRASEAAGRRDVVIPLQEARDLHAEITRILLRLEQASNPVNETQDVINIEVRGADF